VPASTGCRTMRTSTSARNGQPTARPRSSTPRGRPRRSWSERAVSPWRALVTLFCAPLLSWVRLGARADDGITVYRIKPSETDPAIISFNDPNYVVFQKNGEALPELVVFLPGTGGKPEHNKLLMDVIARQGYRVIGLQYDDQPSVSSLCPKDPDPDCSAKFREER